uniref:Radical SAM additional 4Fe4S-binding SPASM domain-containing protein n=1 Tax=Candidatus Kentrum sp. LFY TaxID=2126342 RepID=A0A450WG38_9GAMM|nr:MAG: radical SAM additional 4Fe4S-binding SPASM domain-containing protein [Candidatus Kentron sp. LFY]
MVTIQRIPRLSAELFNIPIDVNRYLIYAPLRKAAFIANGPLVNLLADLQEGKPPESTEANSASIEFLRCLEILDAGPEKPPITVFEGPPCPTAVTLFLTTACNLRCTYCYASAGETTPRTMTEEVAKQGIDYVSANAVKKSIPAFELSFHGGGEPSVNWKTLTRAMDYAKERARQLDITVQASSATNGMLNDRQIDWTIANLEGGVSLSFDGLPKIQDKYRPTALGKGSSGHVLHTIRRFDEANFKYGIRITVTADQIPFLPDSIEFVCRNAQPQQIQVEPSYQMGRWQDAPSAETEGFIAAFREAQERARSLEKEIFFSAARVGTLTNHFCGVTRNTFALSPNGNVSACFEVFSEDNPWASAFFYGKPAADGSDYVFDLDTLNNLRRQAVQYKPYCAGCFAKWHCAGDCYHKALTVSGNEAFNGTSRCHITRELTKDQILERITAAGGIFWHEPPEPGSQDHPSDGKEIYS